MSQATASRILTIRAHGAHAPHQKKASGVATEEQRALLKKSRATTSLGRLAAVNHIVESPPSRQQESDRVKNDRKRQAAGEKQVDPWREYTDQETLDIMHAAGVAFTTAQACLQSDDPASLHKLHCVVRKTYRLDSGKPGFTAIVTTPMFLRAIHLLENPHYIKIATDATWKDLFAQWCLLPVGVLSKQYGLSRFEGGKLPSWTTHFSEVLIGVSSSECKQAYAVAFEVFDSLPLLAQPPLQAGPHVRQVHGDWAASLENARQQVFPDSVRASDYAHMWINLKPRLSSLPDNERRQLKSALSATNSLRNPCRISSFLAAVFPTHDHETKARGLGSTASGCSHPQHLLLPDVASHGPLAVWAHRSNSDGG